MTVVQAAAAEKRARVSRAPALPPSPAPSAAPLFRFGLLSDAADLPDGISFHGTPRYYRHAFEALDRAVAAMRAPPASVDFAVHLGDIVAPVEGSEHTPSEAALARVLAHFDTLGRPVLHLLGNHCLYNAPRGVLNQRLGISAHQGQKGAPHSYYSYTPAPGWRFIALDGYDVSILGWPAGHPLHELAAARLAANNPNANKNSAEGLEGVARRYVMFGGGMSDRQLAWLEGELGAARGAGERAVLLCHLGFHPSTCPPSCLSWDYDRVLTLAHAHADVAVATLTGHAHRDGYVCDEMGIHHRVCAAVLETPPGRDCYGIVSVYEDRMEVEGVDTFESGTWRLRPRAAAGLAAAAL
eukprot:scaffold10.g2374.t1